MIETIPSCGEKVCDIVRLAAKITQQVVDDGIDPERVNWTRFFYEDGIAKVEWELTDISAQSDARPAIAGIGSVKKLDTGTFQGGLDSE